MIANVLSKLTLEHSCNDRRLKLLYITSTQMTYNARGPPNKNETCFYSTVNVHSRLMKYCSKLARLFGCPYVPYSTCYIAPTFVARQH